MNGRTRNNHAIQWQEKRLEHIFLSCLLKTSIHKMREIFSFLHRVYIFSLIVFIFIDIFICGFPQPQLSIFRIILFLIDSCLLLFLLDVFISFLCSILLNIWIFILVISVFFSLTIVICRKFYISISIVII